MSFAVGQRVMVARWKPGTLNTDMNGYYGHVAETHPMTHRARPMVSVSLKGRVGAEVRPHDLDLNGDDPWIFYADELDHAD
jgi:hypothetical protein